MRQRVGLALIVCLAVSVSLLAADGVSVQILIAESVAGLGEPLDVTIRVANAGDSPLVTDARALSISQLWPYVELTHLLPDGSETPIPTDCALPTPLPPSQWATREGTLVPVSAAAILAPGEFVDVLFRNVVRYFPLVDPGHYRFGFRYEFPIYAQTLTNASYGDTAWVVLGEESRVFPIVTPVLLDLELPEGATERDIEWFRAGRRLLLASRTVDDAAAAFDPAESSASAYMEACSQYWIGEAYELYGEYEAAATAYEAVLTQSGSTLFAAYAQRRLEAIAAYEAAQTP